MVIGEIFQDDINRQINGVVKVDQKDDDVLVQELEEYVITNDLKKHFMTFFNSYSNAFHERTGDVGVWISGFFGSGKSHFLKMLSYLLANKEVKGVRTVERFRKKFEDDPGTFMLIDSVTKGQTDTVLFNIDAEGPIDKDKTAVLRVFAKMFYNYLGFYGEDLKVAKLEQHLEKQGKTEEFRRVFEEKNGMSWLESRDAFAFYEDAIVETLQEVLGMSETAARNWFNGTETVEMSISKLVEEIKEYVDSKPEGFHLFFMADEVGQYVGGDTDLLLNLQSLVEKIGSECQGKVWIVCTGQEAIDEIIKARENEFSRIQARFKTRLSLTSASADEVIQKRILKKKPSVEPVLEAVYNKNDSVLRNIFTFTTDAVKDIKGYKGPQDFIKNFPFVPYQFIIMQKVFSEIRKHGNSGKHLSGGERSMLSGFQEAAQKIQNGDEYTLAPFYLFYDTVHTFLDSSIRRVIERCEKAAKNGDGIEAHDVDVLKLLYLIRYVEDIPSNLDNIVILMANRIDMDKVEMRERVRGSLERLFGQNYIGRSGGDTYNFLTDEEQDIQKEIYKNTDVDTAAIITNIGKKIFSGVYDKKKYHLENYDFPFDKFVDDKAIEAGTGGVKLTILTAATDIYDKDESRLIGESFGQAIIVLADTNYFKTIENAEKVWKYVRMRNVRELPASVQNILRHHQEEAVNFEKIATEELEKAIVNARFYVHGEKIEIKTGDAKSKIEQAMKYLITHVYNKLSQITQFAKDDNDIQSILKGKHLEGFEGMEPNREAAQEMEDFLEMQSIKANTTTMADLQKRYQAAPFGWREIDIASVVAMLIYAQKVTVKYGGNTIQADDKELVGLLRKRYEIGKTLIEKRQLISERKIKQVKDILREYFDVMNLPDDEDSLVAFMVENFEAQKAHYETLNRKYLGKTYPDQELVEKGIRLVNGILSQKKDNTAITDRLLQEEDNLLDNKEDLEKVENFFKGPVRVFDEAVTMESRLRNDVSYLKKNEKASLALEEIKKIISAQQNVYRRIPELNDLMATVREGHVKLVFEKRQELGKIVSGCAEEIKVAAEGNEKCMPILTKAHDFFTHFEDRIAEQNSLAILDGMVQQLWAYKDETIEKLEIAKRPAEVVTPEAPSPAIPAQVTPKRKSKAIYRQQFPKKVLGSEEDIDAYVEELRAYLKKMMESGDEIDLK